MAGPAIRSVELARVLGREHDVTLLTREPSRLPNVSFAIASYRSERELKRIVKSNDVVITFGPFLQRHPYVARTDVAVVADLYDPAVLEALVMRESEPLETQVRYYRGVERALQAQLVRADLFLCASERQRQLVVGMLIAVGRVNPSTYGVDPTLRRLVQVVPFGLPTPPPPLQRPGPLRTRLGFAKDDLVVLWGGGIYEWLDPLSLIEAIASMDTDRVKAFFVGTAHPTPDVPTMPIAAQAEARARELGVLDRTVFFGEGWIPYHERAGYLLDADIGVSLHRDHIEATFAFRTRILDYIWAGLPILCSDGDTFAGLVRERRVGEVVPIGDVAAIRSALLRLMDAPHRDHLRQRLPDVAAELQWDKVSAPLMEFCRSPARAPDQLAPYRRLRRRVEIGERVHGLTRGSYPLSVADIRGWRGKGNRC